VISDNVEFDRSGRSALHHGAACGDLAVVDAAIAAGADPNQADNRGWTPLHFAAQAQSAAVIESLLLAGARVDAVDSYGNTPLWRAVFNYRDGDPSPIRTLLRAGADPDKVNAHGKSPRELARGIANYGAAACIP
jgi:ankyrin repeat protein